LNKKTVQEAIEKFHVEIASLSDTDSKQTISELLALFEQLFSENSALKEEIQHLKDEINVLKGG
jgi:regulator of replication initiation timing